MAYYFNCCYYNEDENTHVGRGSTYSYGPFHTKEEAMKRKQELLDKHPHANAGVIYNITSNALPIMEESNNNAG